MQVNSFHVNLFWIISDFREPCVCGGNTQSQSYFLASLLIGIAHVNVTLHHHMCQTIALEAASLHVTSLLAIIFETLYFDKIIHDVQPYQYNPSCLGVNSLHSWIWKV